MSEISRWERGLHTIPPGGRAAIAAAALRGADALKWGALRAYPLFSATATTPIPRWIEPLGARGALRAAQHAYRRVPAYKDFVEQSGWKDNPKLPGSERLQLLPVMDKKNYIQRYSTPQRCLDGRIPLVGTEMDESSGSSGTPFNWVRSSMELNEVHRQLAMFSKYVFQEPMVTINCFSMGAWSTGINTAQALKRTGLVKSPGPDLEKIISTLKFLGPQYPYVITGYPPFLRELLEFGDRENFDWRPYRLFGVVGGEGMSEELRRRLLTRFVAVYSAYGASDMDIGVAGETPLSIWLRQRAEESHALKVALFGEDSRLPMVFQYNPLDYHIECIQDELVVTVSRLCMVSPRIRYNIHDSGGAHSLQTVTEICRDFGLNPMGAPAPPGREHFRLPFLFIRGRSDATISYMGANIYPEDIEQALYKNTEYAKSIMGFCLELKEVGGGAVRPCVHVELTEPESGNLAQLLQERIVATLLQNSRDFKSAVAENPTAADIKVELHIAGTGPFTGSDKRIKRRYIVPSSS